MAEFKTSDQRFFDERPPLRVGFFEGGQLQCDTDQFGALQPMAQPAVPLSPLSMFCCVKAEQH